MRSRTKPSSPTIAVAARKSSGKKDEAEALVPDDFLDATAMVGDEGRVKDRIQAYKAAGVTHLSITPIGDKPLEIIEKVRAWAE